MSTKSFQSDGVLITGGTGSFGKAFVKELLLNYPDLKRIVVYSRDELKQSELVQEFAHLASGRLRCFIGNIRDRDRIKRALEGIDTVVHAAALKQVPAAEYNPFEYIKTNVMGTQNLIEASLDANIRTFVALSTDKAAAPVNLYGATKLCADKLVLAANNVKGDRSIKFSVVRYGNVMGSRGSVIPFFLKHRQKGYLPITHPDMTRFNITLDEGVQRVLEALKSSRGGEIFVPKLPSYRIQDVAEAIAPECEQRVVGLRPGEKIHEEMVTASDSPNTIERDDDYIILPPEAKKLRQWYLDQPETAEIKPGFAYQSGTNQHFLDVQELRELIRSQFHDVNL